MAKIIVACGSGVASSELVVNHISDFFEDHGITGVDVEATDFKKLPDILANYDIYVWIARPNEEIQSIVDKNNITSVNGLPIFTGQNPEVSYKEIIAGLKSLSA
ncbi:MULTISPECIES: PTS sugar transporter subunit IIB [Companilactobacillus]|uniref:Galactitol pts, eiib n=2 Tax=Companilactobacillus kimchii TaxID=2801452 RepID=A0ABR5NSR8_9LACO|nr:PTS sugar transporter subunit IIB [Companilactobacillus kimchii]KAE9562164.1 PTS galactitol transporter subunit IIB [Companilactobacillus kimchii]KRK51216.1 galactitol pts, eiib [Companilactobacillus kimchii DSM 13961 = JCM 10707]OWF34302.1 Protein-N(pi)-phosphohistidine--sugar phosphotransferase [Companilactobacillus kimchii]GEO46223.1 PTS galactitol transporter subunit IIB [Companilactobacillus paralimentarius]